MNPCPCGYSTDPRKNCRCSSTRIQNYLRKISGPLLDRIDIHIELPAVKYSELIENSEAETSAQIKTRVKSVRLIQEERFKPYDLCLNAQMTGKLIRKHCMLNNEAREILKLAMTKLRFSARAYDKILKVSRTIADLENKETIEAEHIAEAIQYRSLDRI